MQLSAKAQAETNAQAPAQAGVHAAAGAAQARQPLAKQQTDFYLLYTELKSILPEEKIRQINQALLDAKNSTLTTSTKQGIQRVIEVAGRENWERAIAQVKVKVKQQAVAVAAAQPSTMLSAQNVTALVEMSHVDRAAALLAMPHPLSLTDKASAFAALPSEQSVNALSAVSPADRAVALLSMTVEVRASAIAALPKDLTVAALVAMSAADRTAVLLELSIRALATMSPEGRAINLVPLQLIGRSPEGRVMHEPIWHERAELVENADPTLIGADLMTRYMAVLHTITHAEKDTVLLEHKTKVLAALSTPGGTLAFWPGTKEQASPEDRLNQSVEYLIMSPSDQELLRVWSSLEFRANTMADFHSWLHNASLALEGASNPDQKAALHTLLSTPWHEYDSCLDVSALKLGPHVGVFVQMLDHHNPVSRDAALGLLTDGVLDEHIAAHIPTMLRLVGRQAADCRSQTLAVLDSQAETQSELFLPHMCVAMELLDNTDAVVRMAAIDLVTRASIDTPVQGIGTIVCLLGHKDADVRRRAGTAWRRLVLLEDDELFKPHMSTLVNLLNRDHRDCQPSLCVTSAIQRELVMLLTSGVELPGGVAEMPVQGGVDYLHGILDGDMLSAHVSTLIDIFENSETISAEGCISMAVSSKRLSKAVTTILVQAVSEHLEPHMPRMLSLLQHQNASVCDGVESMLKDLSINLVTPHIDAIVKLLGHENCSVRARAMAVFLHRFQVDYHAHDYLLNRLGFGKTCCDHWETARVSFQSLLQSQTEELEAGAWATLKLLYHFLGTHSLPSAKGCTILHLFQHQDKAVQQAPLDLWREHFGVERPFGVVLEETYRWPVHCLCEWCESPEVMHTIITSFPEVLLCADSTYSMTPLHFTAGNPEVRIVQMILEAAPEALELKDVTGKTPLDHATAQLTQPGAHHQRSPSWVQQVTQLFQQKMQERTESQRVQTDAELMALFDQGPQTSTVAKSKKKKRSKRKKKSAAAPPEKADESAGSLPTDVAENSAILVATSEVDARPANVPPANQPVCKESEPVSCALFHGMEGSLNMPDHCASSLLPVVPVCEELGLGFQIAQGGGRARFHMDGRTVAVLVPPPDGPEPARGAICVTESEADAWSRSQPTDAAGNDAILANDSESARVLLHNGTDCGCSLAIQPASNKLAQTAAQKQAALVNLEEEFVAMTMTQHSEVSPNSIETMPIEDTDKLCVICMCEPKQVLFAPCGHLCTCESCSDLVMDKEPICPICRSIIQNKFRAYM